MAMWQYCSMLTVSGLNVKLARRGGDCIDFTNRELDFGGASNLV